MSILDKISKPISSISPLNEIPQKKVSPLAPLVKTNPVVNQSVASYIAKPVQEAVIPNFSTKQLSSDISPMTSKSTPSYAPEAKGIDPFKLVPGAVAIGESIEQRSLKPIVEQTKDAMAQQIGYKKDESGKYVKGTLEEQVQATQNFVSGVVGGPAGATRSALNARKIAQSVEEDVISKVLREEVPTLAEAESNAFAKVFKDISNEEDVMTAINRIKTQKKTPYKNTDEFVRAKGIDPASINVIDGEKFIVESTSGKKAVLTELPISSFGKPKFKTLNQPTYTAGRKITDPIEVTIYNGELRISDGANRFTQAVANGDETIPVVIENFDGSIPTESQLTDIRKQANTSSQPKAPVYEGETDLTTKILKDLEGKTTVSKQYILDATNRGELKQVERDLIRGMVEKEGDTINVSDFAKKVKAELLPLTVKSSDMVKTNTKNPYEDFVEEGAFTPKYEGIALPKESRGKVANYKENIYESPIATYAGDTHFNYTTKNYFGHTRIEDMADNKTRRVIEVQSDLYQKGNLEKEAKLGIDLPQYLLNKEDGDVYKKLFDIRSDLRRSSSVDVDGKTYTQKDVPELTKKIDEIYKRGEEVANSQKLGKQKYLKPLEQYNDPTAHFRMIREEIKKAAQDGKTKLQFPTGETAMKIEGLGEINNWSIADRTVALRPEMLKVGKVINQGANIDEWIITDVLGDGKFKAVPKEKLGSELDVKGVKLDNTNDILSYAENHFSSWLDGNKETFDISGKVDTNNPIYKFYEKDVAKYLKKYDGKPVTDDKGVTWIEVPIKKEYGEQAVEAFKETSIFGRGPKIDIENVPDLLKNIVPQDKIKYLFNQNLIKERGALGVYSDALNPELKPVIELYETGGKTYVKTAFHEAYHYLETKVFDPEFVKQLNKDTLAKMTKEDHARYDESIYDTAEKRASEYRADEFAKEETSKSGYKSKIAKVLELIRNAVKKIIEYAKQIKAKLDKMVAESGGGERGSIRLPDDPEQKLVEATKDLPVQKMETGFKAIDEIMPSFEKENRELTELYAQEDSGVAREVSDITNLIDNKDKAKAHIDSLKMEIAISKEFILDNPARQLSKYANKRTGELPEVTGNPTSIFAQKGDDIVTQLGFNSSEEARAAYQKYIENRERYLKTKKNINEVAKDFTEKKQILEAVTKKLRKEGMDRKRRIDSIQEFFNLTDAEMKQVTKGMPDYRLMTEERFNNILKGLEGKAFEAFQLSEARTKVEYTIFDKELIKVDNLLKALKLPEIKNMTRKQLLQLNELMRSFKQGDEFLGVRQLETVVNTDIAGVKTKREVLEDLAKRTGVPYSELMRINVRWFDQYLYDVALANRSPFHKIMVEDTSKAMASANVRYFEFKEKMNFLMARARASKARTFVDRLIPTDDMIFDWLDSDSATKLTLASKMTGDELTAARFIQDKYSQVRDYLVSKGQLDRYRTDYITHIERGFLEAMRDAVRPKYINGKRISTDTFISRTIKGVFQGMKEMFTEYKQQEAVFNIMNQKTGEVLPLEKFFRFSMKRTGNLTPTKNVSKAVLSYMQAFEKKVALDSIVPKIDIYAHSITPNGMTKRGLELDDSIKRFVKEWLNTKRGRVVDTRIAVPGGPVDWAIRSAIAFTRLLDLGINVPTGLASNIGEQTMTVINIGFQKTALGATRALTPQGRKIAQKYAGFVGERVIDKVRDTSKDVGDRFTETVFGLFSDASRRANIEHLLGSMTPQEFAKGEISAERLGQLRLEIGKYRVIDGGESIIGKTALGKAVTQYKSWAVGTLYSSIHNINVLQKMLRKPQNRPFKKGVDGSYTPQGALESVLKSREFQELLRATLMLSFVALTTYGTYSRLRDKKDRSFLEQLAFKSMNDSLSMIGALNPSLWLGVPRITSFLADLSLSLANISMSLVTGERTKQDKEIKGMSKLKATLTPSVVRSIKSIPFEDLMPKKPDAKLQGIKLVPRKKTDLNLKKKNKLEGIKLVPKKNKPIQLQ